MSGVPFSRPYLTGEESTELADVVASRWVAQGPRVRAFEEAFAQAVGAGHAVATSSGTSALHLSLMAAGIGAGDEVIVPSLSFVATANAVRHCGAIPVFADVDPETGNLDPAAAEAVVGERTRALMPVHQLGLPADMAELEALADAHDLALVEDAAPAVGAAYRGRPVGGLGHTACFSLHARKVITTGEGGMITMPDGELAARLRRLRHHGMSVSDLDRHGADRLIFETYDEVGFNYRMTDLQAALGLCQLRVLDEVLALRAHLADRYTSALRDVPHVAPPHVPADRTPAWQSYAVRLAPSAPVRRDELMQRLHADGIATRRGVTAIHREPAYAAAAASLRAPLPHTEALSDETLLLPLFPELTEAQQDRVVERLAAHLAGRRAAA